MEQYDLYQELQQKRKELDVCIRELRGNGTALAEAEKNYKLLLRKWALRLKSDGLAIGLINTTVYGIPEVAELRFKRDVCKTVYEANQEAINSIKLQLRLIDNQIGREWSTPQAGV